MTEQSLAPDEVLLHPLVQQVAQLVSLVDETILIHPEDAATARQILRAGASERMTVAEGLCTLVAKMQRVAGPMAQPAIDVIIELVKELVVEEKQSGDQFGTAAMSDVLKAAVGTAAETRAPSSSDLDRSKKADVKPKRGLR